jgi:hypothetical protein
MCLTGSLGDVGWAPELVRHQVRNDFCKIDLLLKKANGGNSRCASLVASSRIFDRNSPNRNHRDGYRPANLSQFRQPLRGTKPRFRRRRKNRPEENIIRAFVSGFDSSLRRVTRGTHEKLCQSTRMPRLYQHPNRERFFPKVYARSARGPSHIASIIDQDSCFVSYRQIATGLQDNSRNTDQLARRQIFFSDLQPSDSCTQRVPDPLREGRFAVLACRNIQRKPVSDVTEDEFVAGFQGSGAGILSRAGLSPQHSRGDDDIERAKSSDNAPHRWMQHKRAKAGIVTQEVISIPQAKPRQEEKNNAYLE